MRNDMRTLNQNERVYRVDYDSKGFPYVRELTLYEVVRDEAEETTSPRGVMTKLFYEEEDGQWVMKTWRAGGYAERLGTYQTEEDARQAWFEATWEHDYLVSDAELNDFYNMTEVYDAVAERMELPVSVAADLIRWGEKARELVARHRAKELERDYARAKANAGGQETKALRKVRSDAQWGGVIFYNDVRVEARPYYSDAFREELGL